MFLTKPLMEEILHAVINYVPYIVFILFVFRTEYKCSKTFLTAMAALSTILQILLLMLPLFRSIHSEILSIALTIISFLFYFLVIQIDFFQALFRLLVVNNIANILVVFAKCLEGLLFPGSSTGFYHWTYSLCLLIVQFVFLCPIAFVIRKWYRRDNDLEIDTKIWRSLCGLPVIFYVIWYYLFYHITPFRTLYLALQPKISLLMFFLLCAQIYIYCLVLDFVFTYNHLILLKAESNQLNIQSLQYQDFQHQIHDIRTMCHDLRHHINLMCSYADNDKYEELKDYLHDYSNQLTESSTMVFCNLLPLNMLLVYYNKLCKVSQITMEIKLSIPNQLKLSNNEITVLFGNLLENAYDACSTQTTGERKIIVHGLRRNKKVIFTIDNTFDNKIMKDNDNGFLSSKHDGYGFGTKSAQSVAMKYHGFVDFQIEKNMFCVSVILPLE